MSFLRPRLRAISPSLVAVLALSIGAGTLAFRSAAAEELWAIRSGELAIHFNVALLRELGIDFRTDATPIEDHEALGLEEPCWTFPIRKSSDLEFRAENGIATPGGMLGGVLSLDGAITLRDGASGRMTRLDGLEIVLAPAPKSQARRGSQAYLLRSAATKSVFCELVHSMSDFRGGSDDFRIHYLNARIVPEWANAIGRPELAGWFVGFGEMRAGVALVSSTPSSRPRYMPIFSDSALDVKLGDVTNIQYINRAGAYPNGTVALSMETTSCNVGTFDVPWLAPMQENHPLIHMAIYRLLNGRFEQIGVSWLKHGFYALSDNLCSACQDPSDGTYLGIGCSDTYAVGNNSSRTYLGPRSEVNPYTASWTCKGSHFSGGVADCTRRHGSTGHGPVDHRLIAQDADLGNTDATYYYEADYIVRADSNRTNNWASRLCTMSWSGSVWNFTTPAAGNPVVEGPAIGRWGDFSTKVAMASKAAVAPDGNVILAVQTSDLGNGMTHYEYALLNMDSDRQVRSFSIPVPGVPNITNIGFHDNDNLSANDWQVTADSAAITWQTQTYAQDSTAHALVFGYMYNFRFDAGSSPIPVDARLGPFKPGADSSDVAAATHGPAPAPVTVGPVTRPTSRLIDVRPNPFSRTTTIAYETLSGDAQLNIYDAAGRLVRRLPGADRGPGVHRVVWNGQSDSGARVRSGVYYASLCSGTFTAVRSIVILE